jgi:hypothetical protein
MSGRRTGATVVTLALRRFSNSLTNWATSWAPLVFATAIVAKHIPAAQAMLNRARLDLTVSNVLPESLHAGTMRCYRTLAGFMRASRRVTEKQQTLLLVSDLLPLGIILIRIRRIVGVRGARARRNGRRDTILRHRIIRHFDSIVWLWNASGAVTIHWLLINRRHRTLRRTRKVSISLSGAILPLRHVRRRWRILRWLWQRRGWLGLLHGILGSRS